MRIIGITGRSGCGKSSVTHWLAAQSYPCADADEIAREVVQPGSPCLQALQQAFGADILDETGALRRRLLADRAFATTQGTKRLTDITHPEIYRRLRQRIDAAREQGQALFFVDGAVIVGTPFEALCDSLLVVTAPYEQSVQRIVQRDGIPAAMARRRLDAQTAEAVLCAAADYHICNNGTLQDLQAKTELLIQKLHNPHRAAFGGEKGGQ